MRKIARMKLLPESRQVLSCLPLLLLLGAGQAHSQTERWYQVEISVFTNEYSDPAQEYWGDADPERFQLPANAVRLRTLMDYLSLDDWRLLDPEPAGLADEVSDVSITEDSAAPVATPAMDPHPLRASRFRLPDHERDAFLQLPASQSNFSDTNRTLEQSPAHRLLFNAAWRQPVQQAAGAVPIMIQAGNELNGRHELEGSITIRFNPAENRVVLDSGLWFTMQGDNGKIVDLSQSRDMRSNEFHYLDHPAVGILVMVFAYERPEPVTGLTSELH